MFRAKDKAKIIYINGLDNPDANYKEKLNQLKKAYGKGIAPIQVPIMDHDKMIGYINVAKMEVVFLKENIQNLSLFLKI